jgi:hypothetical protein
VLTVALDDDVSLVCVIAVAEHVWPPAVVLIFLVGTVSVASKLS